MRRPTLVEILVLLAIAAIIAAASLQPVMEARTYNRLTGASVTWWDALWVNLRVDTPAHTKEAQ